jgi:hypothetical protein
VKERRASEARKVEVGLVGYGDKAGEPFLELIEDISQNAPDKVTPANIHIGIDSSDLRKLCAILEKEGVTFIRPLKQRSDGMGLSAWDPRSGRPRARIGRTASAHVILRIPGRPPNRDRGAEKNFTVSSDWRKHHEP